MGNRKQPFGYRMEFGQVVEHPQEAEKVRYIFDQYLAGAALKTLADELSQQAIPYSEGKPWNKNMVARILADYRYAGTKEYPKLIEHNTLNAVLALRSAKQATLHQTPAQKVLRQLSGRSPTKKMERQTMTILNRLIADPSQVQYQPPRQPVCTAELRQEMDSVLAQIPIDEDRANTLAFQCAAMQYRGIGTSEYETQRIRLLLALAEPMHELDPRLLRELTSKIQMSKSKIVCLQLKNQQYIQGE